MSATGPELTIHPALRQCWVRFVCLGVGVALTVQGEALVPHALAHWLAPSAWQGVGWP